MIFTFHSLCLFMCYAYKLILCRRGSQKKISSRVLHIDSAMEKLDSNDVEVKVGESSLASTDDKSVATDPDLSNQPLTVYSEKGLTFIPPVYIQRYSAVVQALKDSRWKEDINKVVDMGCAELGFFLSLKHLEGIHEIVAVDIDVPTLEYYSCKTTPLTADFLRMRDHELVVTVLAGSVCEFDKCLENSDAVVCIELIEHLYPQEVDALPYNIFGQVQPRVAVFTTPNSDFNVLFSSLGTAFRHADHKFEWTREQFNDWATNIVTRYPNYQVEFKGIGPAPVDVKDSIGHCSQMAIFWREPQAQSDTVESTSALNGPPHKMVRTSEYKVICQSIYPAKRDERPPELKAQHEAEYSLYQLSRQQRFEDKSGNIFVPLSDLLKNIRDFFSCEDDLKSCLEKAGWRCSISPDGTTRVQYENRSYSEDEEDEDAVDASAPWQSHDSEYWDPWRSRHAAVDPTESADSDWEMGDATPRPWQSEPHLQASSSPPSGHQQPPEALMFRSVNEKQIFGFRGLASSPEDAIRIDDSGYPNSASVQDMDVTLGSSDDLSNSPDDDQEEDDIDDDDDDIPRPPRIHSPPPQHFLPEAVLANNHDAMNNNRDYEGNDLGLEVPHQPRPRPRPPPFPRWLLLLLAEEHDEGFEGGSSSSEDDDDEDEEEDRHVL